MTGTRRLFAWLVHLYTAMGLVCAAGIAVMIVRGDDLSFRRAFMLMMAATAIDATDGWFARRARVKDVLPQFDGRALDDLIDFHTYASLPLLLIWRAGTLPGGLAWLLLLPLLASAYGFSQVNVKTDDGFFLGFPSLWNVVAFYLYVFQLPSLIALGIVVVLSLLTFVPSRYLYPSQPGVLNVLSNVLGVVWAILLALILQQLPMTRMPSGSGPAWNLALALTSNLGPSMVHEVRFSRMYGEYRSTAYFQGQGVQLLQQAGITGHEIIQDPAIASIPAFTFSGYQGFSGNADDGRPKWQDRGEYELTDAIRAMSLGGKRVQAIEITGDWADVRDPEVLAELNEDLESGT